MGMVRDTGTDWSERACGENGFGMRLERSAEAVPLVLANLLLCFMILKVSSFNLVRIALGCGLTVVVFRSE